jgi:hypothetical protein
VHEVVHNDDSVTAGLAGRRDHEVEAVRRHGGARPCAPVTKNLDATPRALGRIVLSP